MISRSIFRATAQLSLLELIGGRRISGTAGMSKATTHARNYCASIARPKLRVDKLYCQRFFTAASYSRNQQPESKQPGTGPIKSLMQHENVWTLPNILTMSRLVAAPAIGYLIIQGYTSTALMLFIYSGFTDFLDGWIARRYNKKSVIGSILDPAADKALMFTLTTCLMASGAVPVWIGAIILARDLGLALSAFIIRYRSLPAPKTFKRYWDMSVPSVQVYPSTISKLNTLLQMVYLGTSLAAPVWLWIPVEVPHYLGYVVAVTTVWSGLDYLFSRNVVKYVK